MALEGYTDQQIVTAILNRDTFVTREFLYKKCYPLFKSVYDKYYTDCENCYELTSEIYVYIMMPKKDSGACKLADFGFRCTLTMWLKIVTENYCKQIYSKRIGTNLFVEGDRIYLEPESVDIDSLKLDMEDEQKILDMMPNQRYRKLIEYRYVENKTNEETANLLGMSMANYYNKHKLAKAQYCNILRKEGLI